MARVLITGASKGIGYDTALTLARAGHSVVATMRNPKGCDLADIAGREKIALTVAALDVDDDASVAALFASGAVDVSSLDVLINNAGILSMDAIEDESVAQYAAVMNTNFLGVVRCCKAVLPAMRARRSGLIINITSIAGKIAIFGQSAYVASKFALEGFTESLAQEALAFGVRVAIVEPGIIATPMTLANLPRPKADSLYPHGARMAAFYGAVPATGPAPAVVSETMKDLIEGKLTEFRNPTGPDALPFLGLRASMTDQQWIDLGGIADNGDYYKAFLAVSGMDLTPAS